MAALVCYASVLGARILVVALRIRRAAPFDWCLCATASGGVAGVLSARILVIAVRVEVAGVGDGVVDAKSLLADVEAARVAVFAFGALDAFRTLGQPVSGDVCTVGGEEGTVEEVVAAVELHPPSAGALPKAGCDALSKGTRVAIEAVTIDQAIGCDSNVCGGLSGLVGQWRAVFIEDGRQGMNPHGNVVEGEGEGASLLPGIDSVEIELELSGWGWEGGPVVHGEGQGDGGRWGILWNIEVVGRRQDLDLWRLIQGQRCRLQRFGPRIAGQSHEEYPEEPDCAEPASVHETASERGEKG